MCLPRVRRLPNSDPQLCWLGAGQVARRAPRCIWVGNAALDELLRSRRPDPADGLAPAGGYLGWLVAGLLAVVAAASGVDLPLANTALQAAGS